MRKKTILFILFLSILNSCLSKNTNQDDLPDLKNDLIIAACCLSVMLSVHCNSADSTSCTLKSEFKPGNLAKNFLYSYFMSFATTFFHEFGHGVAKRLLTGDAFKIHLGKSRDDNPRNLIDSKYLSLEGFDQMQGYNTSQGNSGKKYSRMQKILINLSGGVAGIAGYYFLRTAMILVQNLGSGERLSLRNALQKAITLDQIVLSQCLNICLPMNYDRNVQSDAVKIWQALGVSDSTIKKISDKQSYIAMLAFIALAFKQARNERVDELYIADNVLIGLANYFLQGFLQLNGV